MAWWLLLHFKNIGFAELECCICMFKFWMAFCQPRWDPNEPHDPWVFMSLWRRRERVIVHSPVSSPLSSAAIQVLLDSELTEGDSQTRLSAEQKGTQTMSYTVAWSTPPWGGSSQYGLAHINTYTSQVPRESLITQVMQSAMPLTPI